MNDINMEERIAIKDSARSLKKYGSTSSNSKRCESFIKHNVMPSDTLQGLALKYGVTTEQIRRANTLWANDSLFLRKILLIPRPVGSSCRNGEIETPVNLVQTTSTDTHQLYNNNNNNHSAIRQEASCSLMENKEVLHEEENYSDFLVKIDCAIASTKNQVMMAHDNSQFVEDDTIFWKRKGALSRLKQQRLHKDEVPDDVHCNHICKDDRASTSSGGSNNDSTDIAVPVVVMSQGRKVRNSLQKLEKQQNDIFEL